MQILKKGKWSAFIRKINFCVYAINITELIYSRKFNYVIIQLYLRYLLQWIILFISFLIQFLIYIYFFKYFSTSANYLSLNPPIPTVHCSPSSPFSLFPTLPLPHPLPPPLSLFPLSSPTASCFIFCRGVRTNVTKYRKDLFSRALKKILLKNSQRLNAFAQFQMNKGGKFLKKLRCCVFGKIEQGNLV